MILILATAAQALTFGYCSGWTQMRVFGALNLQVFFLFTKRASGNGPHL